VRHVRADGPRVWLTLGVQVPPAHELIAWLGARVPLRDVSIQEPPIEAIVRRIYEEGLLTRESIPAIEELVG
jgi:ABC-2 type transport system ATP-binding protein